VKVSGRENNNINAVPVTGANVYMLGDGVSLLKRKIDIVIRVIPKQLNSCL
jgi:hypothetical protein